MAARSADGSAAAAEREIVATRTFAAPRELVWAAWTDPAHVASWWGPRGFTCTISEMEVRPGGRWRLRLRGPDGKDHPNELEYVQVTRPERLVIEHRSAPPFRMTATFAERGGETAVSVRMTFASAGERDRVVAASHADEGLAENLEKLGEALDGVSASGRTAFFFPPGEPVIYARRVLDAPRRLVWEAVTRPEHVARWYGPRAARITRCEIDLTVGGAWRVEQRFPDGSTHGFGGVHREIVPPERIVRTWRWDGAPAAEALETMTLVEREGRTLLTMKAVHPSAAIRDGHLRAGMLRGGVETLDRLEEVVEALRGAGAGTPAPAP